MRTRHLVICTLLLFVPTAVSAQTASERAQADLGDGMRAYVEGRYDAALTHLYRAVAAEPSSVALKLIVRAHDFQGNCSARAGAAEMLRELFPSTVAPGPQRCSVTGEVDIRCAAGDESVRVDESFDAPCGARVELPVGTHRLEARMGKRLTVEVVAATVETADMLGGPGKWYLERSARIALPDRWLKPNLLEDPDMPRSFKWKRPD